VSPAEAIDTGRPARRTLTEGAVGSYLGIERLEIYLLSCTLGVGQYDSVTHLLMFNDDDAERIAAEMGLTWKRRPHAAQSADI